MNRRDFLSGRFAKEKKEREPSSGFGASESYAMMMLPPEFSPAMLKAQVRQLGLDPDTMSEEEIALTVIETMYAQRPGQDGA